MDQLASTATRRSFIASVGKTLGVAVGVVATGAITSRAANAASPSGRGAPVFDPTAIRGADPDKIRQMQSVLPDTVVYTCCEDVNHHCSGSCSALWFYCTSSQPGCGPFCQCAIPGGCYEFAYGNFC